MAEAAPFSRCLDQSSLGSVVTCRRFALTRIEPMRIETLRGLVGEETLALTLGFRLAMQMAALGRLLLLHGAVAALARETQINDLAAHVFLRKASRLMTFGPSAGSSAGFCLASPDLASPDLASAFVSADLPEAAGFVPASGTDFV